MYISYKSISVWATKNQKKAIALIAFIEVFRLGSGFMFGSTLEVNWQPSELNLIVLSLVLAITLVQQIFGSTRLYARKVIANTLLFTSSLALSVLLGIHMKNGDLYAPVHATEVKSNFDIEAIKKETQAHKVIIKHKKGKHPREKEDRRVRITSLILFLISLPLTALLAALSCTLACSGFGIFAAISALATLGVFVGGIYFFIRIFRRDRLKRFKRLRKDQKKREYRRYWRTMLFTLITVLGGLLAFTLLF